MALDTAEKRASAVSLNPGAPPSPTPNALLDQEWRQESGWAYSGILIGVGVPPAPIPPAEEIAADAVGVLFLPGIDRRRYIRWEQEILAFWVEYFEEILDLSEAQARLRAQEVVAAASQMPDEDPKDFWLRYFRRVRQLEARRLMIELDDEALLVLTS